VILCFILVPEKGVVRGKTIRYQIVSYFYSTSNMRIRRVRYIRSEMNTTFFGGKHEAQKRGCILKKGAKIRKGFRSHTAGSKTLVNILLTFVFHKKGN
jgi:hypothetical protein